MSVISSKRPLSWAKQIFSLCCFYALGSHACELRVQVSDFPPYSYQMNGQWLGSLVVLSERLAQKLNCDLKLLEVPWARALLLLRSGDLDLMFNMTPTMERKEFLWFSRAHHMERLAFATILTESNWRQVKQVNQLKEFPGFIALTQGAYMGDEMAKLLTLPAFRRKLIEVAERRAKNELVIQGRAQGLVEDYDYLQYAIANFPAYRDMHITPLIFSTTPVYLAISKQSPLMSMQADIERALAELDAAGLWYTPGS